MSGKRRAPLAPSSLTSLVDVLFILVFAALVQRASAVAGAQGDEAPEVAVTGAAVGAKAVQAPARPAQSEALRKAAISTLAAELETRPAILARVTRSGVLRKLEAPGLSGASGGGGSDRDRGGGGAVAMPPPGERGGAGEGPGLVMGLPLVEPVADPDVAVGYIGDRDASQRLCSVIAAQLRTAGSALALDRALVVIAVDAPVSELMVALVGGLRRDVAHCLSAHRTAAVLLDAAAVAELVPSTSTEATDDANGDSAGSTPVAPSATPSAPTPLTTPPSTPTDGEAP